MKDPSVSQEARTSPRADTPGGRAWRRHDARTPLGKIVFRLKRGRKDADTRPEAAHLKGDFVNLYIPKIKMSETLTSADPTSQRT